MAYFTLYLLPSCFPFTRIKKYYQWFNLFFWHFFCLLYFNIICFYCYLLFLLLDIYCVIFTKKYEDLTFCVTWPQNTVISPSFQKKAMVHIDGDIPFLTQYFFLELIIDSYLVYLVLGILFSNSISEFLEEMYYQYIRYLKYTLGTT